jgi:hypothetical protein
MATQEEPLNERALKFRDLSANFFARFRTDFLTAIDKEGAVMNLKEFLDKLNKVDTSKVDAKSKLVFDKLLLEPSKVDQLMGTANQMFQVLAGKEKIPYDQAKILLAFAHTRLQDFVAKMDKELPGVLDEIAKMK